VYVRLKCVQVEGIEVPNLMEGLSNGNNPRTIGPPEHGPSFGLRYSKSTVQYGVPIQLQFKGPGRLSKPVVPRVVFPSMALADLDSWRVILL